MRLLIATILVFFSLTTFSQSALKDSSQVFNKVEVDAAFPGGDLAWKEYVTKAIMKHIKQLERSNITGTCIVRFIVDKKGNVSAVEATTLVGSTLAEIAVNAIKNGPKWIPAIQDGRYVNAYRYQPVTFKFAE
jgi:periplasmic protein TonB